MAVTTLNKVARTIIARNTITNAGAVTRATIDLRTSMGGVLSGSFYNLAVPSVQAEARILAAFTDAATPAAGSAGSDWRTLAVIGGGISYAINTPWTYKVPPGIQHLEIEYAGATGANTVTDAYFTEITGSTTV